MIELSASEARRVALAAVGLDRPRPARAGRGALSGMFDRLGMAQIDSVNVLARAHTLPAFSRFGGYDVGLLEKMSSGKRRALFEYWGHEASLIRADLQPSLRWRMARARDGRGIYDGLARFGRERRAFIDAMLAEIARRGPLAARDLDAGEKGAGGWWGWSDAKRALEWLFWAGLVTTHGRRGFERVYDLPERATPEIAALPTPDDAEGQRRLISAAAQALGVATVGDLRAYWRIGPQEAGARVAELVEQGALIPARVEGWRQPAYLAAGTEPPRRRPRAAALVSPFDPLLWERDRAERLLDFRYRIEIYVPEHKRQHGYYVLPLLAGERIAARLDLKADRAGRRLVVAAAWLEPGSAAGPTAEAAADELRRAAAWLGLDDVAVQPKGDLAAALAALTR
ncbi:winged helix-turn-helix domain-containing protein [Methylopila henanensis]|uniref:Winged helix-turn-helix domain-containing protein n=1 Tax=Methylopila henanensis TaxID=873516 RepID=A0ABW4K5I5_9HYPH